MFVSISDFIDEWNHIIFGDQNVVFDMNEISIMRI